HLARFRAQHGLVAHQDTTACCRYCDTPSPTLLESLSTLPVNSSTPWSSVIRPSPWVGPSFRRKMCMLWALPERASLTPSNTSSYSCAEAMSASTSTLAFLV